MVGRAKLAVVLSLTCAGIAFAGEGQGGAQPGARQPNNVLLVFLQTNRFAHGGTSALAARFVSSAWQKWREDSSQASSMAIALVVGGIAGAATSPQGQPFSFRDAAQFLLGFVGSYAGTIHFYPPVKNEAKKDKEDKARIEQEINRRVQERLAGKNR